MNHIAEIYGVKVYVDAVVPSNEAWLLKEEHLVILAEIKRLKAILECSGIRLTGIQVVAD